MFNLLRTLLNNISVQYLQYRAAFLRCYHKSPWEKVKLNNNCCCMEMLLVKIKSRLKFLNLHVGWFSICFFLSPNYSWIGARRQKTLKINLGWKIFNLNLILIYNRHTSYIIMHQSIPAVPSYPHKPPPPGLLRGICPPGQSISPRVGAFTNFALPGGRAFANPELLTCMGFPIRIIL